MKLTAIISAALDPTWNKKFRPQIAPVAPIEFCLPHEYCDKIAWLERKAGANALGVCYGGGIFDIMRGVQPRDMDMYIISRQHPLVAMARIAFATIGSNTRLEFHKGTPTTPHKGTLVLLTWKRFKIRWRDGTVHDIGFLMAPFSLATIADDPDIGTCALAATRRHTWASQRHHAGMASRELVFRPMNERDRRKHPKRRRRYEEKCPDWPIRYACADDAQYFSNLNKAEPR